MWPAIAAIFWDPAAARAALVVIVSALGVYFATPATRPWYERAVPAAATALGIGVASAPSGRSKEVEAELAAIRAELAALRPKP